MNIEKINISGNEYDIKDAKAQSMITDEFSDAQSYTAGDYCIYENALYKFTSDKEAGAWDSGKVTATNIDTELSGLNSRADEVDVKLLNLPYYTINYTAGSEQAALNLLDNPKQMPGMPSIGNTPYIIVFADTVGASPFGGGTVMIIGYEYSAQTHGAQFYIKYSGEKKFRSKASGTWSEWSDF